MLPLKASRSAPPPPPTPPRVPIQVMGEFSSALGSRLQIAAESPPPPPHLPLLVMEQSALEDMMADGCWRPTLPTYPSDGEASCWVLDGKQLLEAAVIHVEDDVLWGESSTYQAPWQAGRHHGLGTFSSPAMKAKFDNSLFIQWWDEIHCENISIS